jgi:predicted dienelactone hydrolase
MFIFSVLASCLSSKAVDGISRHLNDKLLVDTLSLFDTIRNRKIPLAVYRPTRDSRINNQKIIIFSPGYGQNKGGDYLNYSYLTQYLASKGYFVASIQHELPSDSLILLTGIPQVVRLPFWERGTDNILFVINELKRCNPELDFKHITLIGHSNGADMTALFPQKYPGIVDKVITLDNRRMALPRTSNFFYQSRLDEWHSLFDCCQCSILNQ